MVEYDYVMSGAAHTRITLLDTAQANIRDELRDCFDKTQGNYSHRYTCLFNAYAEARIGKHLYETDITGMPLHADSGGLQVITRGSVVTPEIRKEVYKTQGLYSGVAMCFDEIPLRVDGASKIGDTENRVYDRDMVEPCIIATCNNIVDQIRNFRDMGSESKVMLIAHGNSMQDYVYWLEKCVDYIPSEYHASIAGISLAGTSSGAGDKQDIERIYSFVEANVPENWKKNLHLLGVGSISRMLPVAALVQSGLLTDMVISYDSTTHSSNLTRGRYIDSKSKVIRSVKGDYIGNFKILDCIKEKYPDYDIDPEYYVHIMSANRDNFIKEYGKENMVDYHKAMLLTTLSSIQNTARELEAISTKKKAYLNYVKKKNFYMKHLLDVKSKDDYSHLMASFSSAMNKSGVKTLDDTKEDLTSFFS